MESSHLVAMADGVLTPGKCRGADWRTKLAGEFVVSTDPGDHPPKRRVRWLCGSRSYHAFIPVVDHLSQLVVVDRAAQFHGVPMALVLVQAGANRGTFGGSRWSAIVVRLCHVAAPVSSPQHLTSVLMPSTPFAYPQVVSRRFAYFRVVRTTAFLQFRTIPCRVRFPAVPPKVARQGHKPYPSFLFPSTTPGRRRPPSPAPRFSSTALTTSHRWRSSASMPEDFR